MTLIQEILMYLGAFYLIDRGDELIKRAYRSWRNRDQ